MATRTYDAYGASPWRGEVETGRTWQVRPMWIIATVLAFMVWWPLGLMLLGFLIGSGRMGCKVGKFGMNNGAGGGIFAGWRGFGGGGRPASSSGNHAFDEYRADMLRRLEEEQKEFTSFLERLRVAKDKAEFDAFMAERRQRPAAPADAANERNG